MPIIRRSNCVPLPIVVCPVYSCCDAGESGGKLCALCGERCLTAATRLSSITTATTEQTTIGSGTQLDLLMMGIKMPESC